MTDFPWTKLEILDVVIGGCRPVDDRPETWSHAMMGAWGYLALGRPEGRASPRVEHELYLRIRRVYLAVCDGRDPYAAYDAPLTDEQALTAEMQMKGGELEPLFEEIDRTQRQVRQQAQARHRRQAQQRE